MKAISLLFFLFACASEDHLSPEAILNRKLRQCYEESDSYMNRKGGRLQYAVNVRADGVAKKVKIYKSDFKSDRNLEACVTGVLKKTKFLSSVDGQDYEILRPINFEAIKL